MPVPPRVTVSEAENFVESGWVARAASGFFEESDGTVLLEASSILLGHAGHDDYRDGLSGGILFEGLQNVGAAHLGQEHIQEDEIRHLLASHEQGFFAINGAADFVSSARQGALGRESEKLAVFDEQNSDHLT